MLFLAHLRGDPIGLSVGGLTVISKSLFLTVSIQMKTMIVNKNYLYIYRLAV